jgi:hypothetical protein
MDVASVLDWFQVVAPGKEHCDCQQLRLAFFFFCSFLQCFMPEMRKSKVRTQRAVCSTFTPGTVLQHHSWSMTVSAILRFDQSRKISLKIFLESCKSSWLHRYPDHNSSDSYQIFHSESLNRRPSSANLELSLCSFRVLPLLWRQPLDTISFSCCVYWRSILCKMMCHSVTIGRGYVCRGSLLHFN